MAGTEMAKMRRDTPPQEAVQTHVTPVLMVPVKRHLSCWMVGRSLRARVVMVKEATRIVSPHRMCGPVHLRLLPPPPSESVRFRAA